MTDHGHDHDHARTVKPMVDEITDFEVLEIALRELCIEKGIFTAEEHRRFTEFAEQIGPTPAARLVARAWLDPDFKALALAEPMTASKEVGGVDWLEPTGFGTPSDFTAFQILEDTPAVHNVIVCASAPAIRGPSSATPPPSGTAHRTTVGGWCAGPDRFSPSSASTSLTTSKSVSRIPIRSTASWSCPCDLRHRRLERRPADRDHHPGLSDRRRPAEARGGDHQCHHRHPPPRHASGRRMKPEPLQRIVDRNQVWPVMAAKYGGVEKNPVPPWKTSLDGLCDALDHAACATDLPTFKERRDEEDDLSATVYSDLPYPPESQLVSLAHSLLSRGGVITEDELQQRLSAVRTRLEA